MPKFYFHLRNDLAVDDDEGMELPDLATAREYALFNARSIAAENVHHGHLKLSHRIEIADENQQILDIVTFGDAIKLET
jgi:hypothetical protein